MRIESCYSLSIEEILTFHDVLILIKIVVNKNKNHFYYNMFLNSSVSYRYYISIELTFLQEFMLIRQTNQKCTMFATIGIF